MKFVPDKTQKSGPKQLFERDVPKYISIYCHWYGLACRSCSIGNITSHAIADN